MTEYHGNVRVGGPAQTHELAKLMITKVAVGPGNNNAYLLRSRITDEQVLIDAADEADTLLKVIGEGGISRVITTHQHGDHWQALAEVVARTNAITVAGRDDAEGIPVPTDELVGDGDRVEFGGLSLEVIQLVGHTPGSIALLYDDPTGPPHLFTGDSLFPGGVGNTRGNKKNFESLLHDVETKLFNRLPDETWVYPGHGADTTLGAERPSLPEWRARGW
ncbi:MBL fold metallo-hydrolase [Kribbella sp. CA-294648]|uniref:MBL fold metallo-hydrolase n=1 Tax=Kribbella sp. CA-294648 TaxID=3239948 RepID=UPI003D8B732F